MNLPNLLTLSRLLAIPVLVVLIPTRSHDLLAAGVFVVASLTDTLDGQLARRRAQVTDLGKFLDPLADKLFILSVLVVLVQQNLLAAWIVVLIFGRELLITILRSFSAAQGTVIAATPFGKTKTVTQTVAVLLLILQRPYPVVAVAAQVVVALAVVFTVASGLDYVWRFRFLLIPGGGRPQPSVGELARRLIAAGRTIAVAESCTGGLVCELITEQPGSSVVLLGGVVAYSNDAKKEMLGVPADVLESDGAVSRRTALAMARGVRVRLGADLAVAVTGIAGPAADGTDKPIGLTYVAVAGAGWEHVKEFRFTGDRAQNRREAALEALQALLEAASGPVPAAPVAPPTERLLQGN